MSAASASALSTASPLLRAQYLAFTAAKLSMSACWQRVRGIARLLRCSGGSAGRWAGRLVMSGLGVRPVVVIGAELSIGPGFAFDVVCTSKLANKSVGLVAVDVDREHGDLLRLLASRCACHEQNVLQEVRHRKDYLYSSTRVTP